jgi:hypothetical protein
MAGEIGLGDAELCVHGLLLLMRFCSDIRSSNGMAFAWKARRSIESNGWSIPRSRQDDAYSGQRRGLRSTKLPELLLIEVLRSHLANTPASDRGWLAGLRDPLLAPAMRAIHTAPERNGRSPISPWKQPVSRSFLDNRFRNVLGLSPIRYLNEWRMRVAQDLLATTEVTVAAIARRVGYDSEEALSRAFKRAHGRSPSLWRAGRSARW